MDKPIRIAQIMGKLWAGGVEMVVFNYYRAIDKSKIQFDFYYDADSTVNPPKELIELGARFYKLPPYQKLPQYINELKKYFKENRYTIVHSHLNTLSVFPLFAAWNCNIPVRIAHNHSVPAGTELGRDALKYFLRIFAKTFSTDYFACSEKAARWMFGDKMYESNKVIVVKNAIDFKRFSSSYEDKEKNREELGLKNKFVVGHVGRFTYAKNHFFLLNVFLEISKKRADAVLLLVGDGELHEAIIEKVNEMGLNQKVIFIGKVSNPEKFYSLVDVMIIPSVFEGLSLATIESQIAGVPAIVSEAIPEEAIISNGVKRLKISDENWEYEALRIAGKTIVLNEKSIEYNIEYAAKKLEKWYMNKEKEYAL